MQRRGKKQNVQGQKGRKKRRFPETFIGEGIQWVEKVRRRGMCDQPAWERTEYVP